ncbi:thermonuclease family protein [Streptomyces sp. JJ38]|uniref:thermonuclease family protein n=1 Tax=Streptomyces sp. JJ38 TaxID=2738128 RepID=UPI001C58B301|nr:thermonuclease family protein [Streptomyces sp. JJ38]
MASPYRPDPQGWRRDPSGSRPRWSWRRVPAWVYGAVAALAVVLAVALVASLAGTGGQPRPDPPVAETDGAPQTERRTQQERDGTGEEPGRQESPADESEEAEPDESEEAEPGGSEEPRPDASVPDEPREGDTGDGTGEPGGGADAVVERIVDGDTLHVTGTGEVLPEGERVTVRLLAVDAPEVRACYGDEATERLEELVPVGTGVRIERDAELKDGYDRYLLYVWNEDDEFVNAEIARSGHAEAELYPPNDARWPEIRKAGDEAETAKSGLWSACAAEQPPPEEEPVPTPREPAEPDPAEPDPAEPEPGEPGLPPGPPPGPDLDCADIDGPVLVGPGDPHRLDADGDGIGCE